MRMKFILGGRDAAEDMLFKLVEQHPDSTFYLFNKDGFWQLSDYKVPEAVLEVSMNNELYDD